nr:DUF6466 family protein [Bifidobacterium colobi]
MRAMKTGHAGGARGKLGLRIALVIAAVLLLVIAGLAAVNLSAAVKFNQATTSLNANIKAAQDESTDLSTLNAQQQQTDAQFAEAGQMRSALLPQIRDAIDANASVSAELTKITLKKVEAQQTGSTENQTEANGSASSSKKNAKKGGSLTEEQKKQVEELMKANQQSTDTQANTKKEQKETQSKTNGTTKPW